ncbi:MAG: hypothetical protein ACM3VZ_10360 [Acidobacteriota bacterium]
MLRPLSACCIVLAALAGPTASFAQGLDPKAGDSALRLNGFGTLGVTSTFAPEGWYFRRDAAQNPSSRKTSLETDSRLGLQAHYEVNPQLELASQVVLKRRLAGSKPIESVEWLFASYKPADAITWRVGRTNPDLFLLSDYRNVGVAYPWVRPNIELYAGLPLYTMDGTDISYSWSRGDANWRVKTFWGSSDSRTTLSSSPEQVHFKLNTALGALVTREEDGLLMRATLAGAHLTAKTSSQAYQALSVLQGLQNHPDPAIASQAAELERNCGLATDTAIFGELGVSYDRDDWLWSAEYSRVAVSTGTRSAQAGYVSVGRRFGDFTLYTMAGRVVSKLGVQRVPDWSSLGPTIQQVGTEVATGLNNSRSRQTSLSVGTRWDVHPQMALKVQLDHHWVGATGGGLWVGSHGEAAQPNVLSATLDFTF